VRLDVLLGEALPAPADVAGRVVVAIDVLRATTVMVAALANGARAVVPFAEVQDVVEAARRYGREEVRLAGERRSMAIPGFDAGNSPGDMRPDVVSGRTVLLSTTNGTSALLASHGAWRTYVGAFVNLTVTADAVREGVEAGHAGLVLCAGQERRVALEDVVCAGLLVDAVARARRGLVLGVGALAARRLARRYQRDLAGVARDAAHARALRAAGFADDVAVCLQRDTHPVRAVYADRQVTGERLRPSA
jgi:2-phosphosulfolactate phosphatase